MTTKREKRIRRHRRVRAKVAGTADRPRLSVFRSSNHTLVQLIDDASGKTIVSASDFEMKGKGKRSETAEKVGEAIAKKAAEKNITKAVFDRGGYHYHGAVKAVAEGARKGGLQL